MHISKASGARTLIELQERGLIAATKRSAFSLKIKMATEWRLTEFCSDIDGAFATKDFMKWTQPKKQNTVPLVRPSVPLVRPYGPPGETVVAKLSRNGPSGETVEAKIQAAQSHHEDTYSLPGGKPSKTDASLNPTPTPAADDWRRNSKTPAERLNAPTDDLSIPEFLRRTVN